MLRSSLAIAASVPGRHARCGVTWHGIGDVDRIAEPRIEIGDDWRRLHLADRAHHFEMGAYRQDIGVGQGDRHHYRQK